MQAHIPNIDEMGDGEQMAFWFDHQQGRNARVLFPDGGTGTRRAAADLANYASNKAAARTCKVLGDAEGAEMYESIAARIYAGLPAFAQFKGGPRGSKLCRTCEDAACEAKPGECGL